MCNLIFLLMSARRPWPCPTACLATDPAHILLTCRALANIAGQHAQHACACTLCLQKERKNYARRRVLRKGVDYRHKPATTPYQREETGDNSKASGPPCWVKASYGGRGVVRLEVSALCASMCLVCTMLCMQRMACRCSLRAQSLALARVMPSFWRACRVWMW